MPLRGFCRLGAPVLVSMMLVWSALASAGCAALSEPAVRGGLADALVQAQVDALEEQLPQAFPLVTRGLLAKLAGSEVHAVREVLPKAVSQSYRKVMRAYAVSRVVHLKYAVRTPQHMGSWRARDEIGAREADPNGALTQWDDHYYITHNWSRYGQIILTMVPGDTVTINGKTMRVENMFDYPNEGYLDEIQVLVGSDVVVLQTCEVGDELVRIVYGDWMSE